MTDDPVSELRFYWIEGALLLAPAFANFGYKLNSWLRPKPLAYFNSLSLLLIGAAIFFNLSSWSFRSDTANLIIGDLGYFAAVSVLFALASHTKSKTSRWALRSLFSIPVVLGLLLGTVGVLGLMFVIDDSVPRQEAMLNSEYGYRICFTGNALANSHTAELDIVKYPRFLPIQKTVWHRSFDGREYKYHDGLRVTLSTDGRQILVTLEKKGGGQAVEYLELR